MYGFAAVPSFKYVVLTLAEYIVDTVNEWSEFLYGGCKFCMKD